MKMLVDSHDFFPIGSTCEVRLDGLRSKTGSFLNDAIVTASLETFTPRRDVVVKQIQFKYVPKSRGVYLAQLDVPETLVEETACGINILIVHNFKKMRLRMRRPARVLSI